jgi:hypothetical protein
VLVGGRRLESVAGFDGVASSALSSTDYVYVSSFGISGVPHFLRDDPYERTEFDFFSVKS